MLDQNFPVPVGRALTGHSCDDAYTLGWAELANGELLAQAEQAGYDLLLTADRRIALVVTSLNSQTALLRHVGLIQSAIDRATPGSFEEVEIPRPQLNRRPWP